MPICCSTAWTRAQKMIKRYCKTEAKRQLGWAPSIYLTTCMMERQAKLPIICAPALWIETLFVFCRKDPSMQLTCYESFEWISFKFLINFRGRSKFMAMICVFPKKTHDKHFPEIIILLGTDTVLTGLSTNIGGYIWFCLYI